MDDIRGREKKSKAAIMPVKTLKVGLFRMVSM